MTRTRLDLRSSWSQIPRRKEQRKNDHSLSYRNQSCLISHGMRRRISLISTACFRAAPPPAPLTLPFPLANLNCPECGQFAGERHFGTSRIPSQAGEDARQMPVYHAGDYLHVGVDQGTQTGTLPRVGERGATAIRHGSLADGVGASTVRDYLDNNQRDAQAYSAPRGMTRYTNAPEVRIIGPTNAKEANRVAHAVRLVNAALPAGSKMQLGAALPGFSLRDTLNDEGLYFVSGRERNNTIHVEFIPTGE